MTQAPVHRQTVTVNLEMGLHLRPLSQIAQLSNRFRCEVRIRKAETCVNAKSYFDLMTLNAGLGTVLELETAGEEAENALESLVQLFASNFETV